MLNYHISMQLLLFNLLTLNTDTLCMFHWTNMEVLNSPNIKYEKYENIVSFFCDVVNLGSFNGDYGFCDRLLCGN